MTKSLSSDRYKVFGAVAATLLFLTACTTISLMRRMDSSRDDHKALPMVIFRRQSNASDELAAEAQWAQDVRCYALPYGLIGFLSHVWNYYTIFCLYKMRRPFVPWKPITGAWHDLLLAAIQGISTVILTSLNIKRCDFSWQLVCLSVWKMFLSILLCLNTLIAYYRATTSMEAKELIISLAIVYWLACLPGFAGLVSIVQAIGYYPGILQDEDPSNSNAAKCEVITIVLFATFALLAIFIIPAGSKLVYGAGPVYEGGREAGDITTRYPFFWLFYQSIYLFGVVFALWSDWMLGVVAQDIYGVPKDYQALYWLYFLFKRLPFFTT